MKKDFKTSAAELFISEAGAQDQEQSEPKKQRKTRAAKKPNAAKIGDTETAAALIPNGYKLVRESKTARIQLLIRPSLKDAIKAKAEAEGVSMNDLINNILEKHIERN